MRPGQALPAGWRQTGVDLVTVLLIGLLGWQSLLFWLYRLLAVGLLSVAKVKGVNVELHKEGRKRVFEDLEFYACNGAVRVHDRRTGEQKDIAPAEFLERAEALAEALPHYQYYAEKQAAIKMANEVEEVCDEAAAMGDPFDPQVAAYRRRHQVYKRAAVQVPGVPGARQTAGGILVVGDN